MRADEVHRRAFMERTVLLDAHDAARHQLAEAGGLRRYLWVEAGRALHAGFLRFADAFIRRARGYRAGRKFLRLKGAAHARDGD